MFHSPIFNCTGIVPITCNELFNGIDAKKAAGTEAEYQVKINVLYESIVL